MAIFISSPEFINHSTVTRQEYADLPLKTYASVQLANVVTMQETRLWIQKVYKEMQDPTNKYWDTEPIYRVMLDRSNSFSEFGNFHVNEFLDSVGVDVGANARQAHNKVYKVGIPSEIKKGRTAWSNYALVQRDDDDNLCLLPTRKGEHFKTTYKLSGAQIKTRRNTPYKGGPYDGFHVEVKYGRPEGVSEAEWVPYGGRNPPMDPELSKIWGQPQHAVNTMAPPKAAEPSEACAPRPAGPPQA
ncbi:hypothetical protein CYMTET_40627 [Cymbomonas tetramitiformis]|uniref:Uncharacterized protein n=1 Tax=Cymbomonas tetramitiformis TaxID=36881 RepID=A0AAE0C9X2_9CHLO|nr:hypothetical protein CYMTET_40627 [Cymbomonas tetramitiformis]